MEKLIKNGGSAVRPKTKIEAEGRGWFALFTDSEGDRMGLYGDMKCFTRFWFHPIIS